MTEKEMAALTGGNGSETWGEAAASSGLGYATASNPLMWVPGATLAIAGATAYYGGWVYSAIF